VGGLLSIVLAVIADVAFVLLQRFLTPWAARRTPHVQRNEPAQWI
jgi:ABC-type proline/glycine betaine transport system permease subunit